MLSNDILKMYIYYLCNEILVMGICKNCDKEK